MSSLIAFTRTGSSGTAGTVGGLLFSNLISCRQISVSSSLYGKRNIRKFFLGNKRGTRLHRKAKMEGKTASWDPIYTEVKASGFHYDGVYHKVPEMIPDIIVPDLTDFKVELDLVLNRFNYKTSIYIKYSLFQLKPYVSYKTADIYQTEFTPENLFESVNNKLDDQGNPLGPNEMEKLTPEEAWIMAKNPAAISLAKEHQSFGNAWTKV
ncbi:39S ribosomal protein L41, mitochondrial [Orchesella cincta]|uniref:39S ribosomal protein L41, mitochondrial n=1 Tax=Orchesella cincta TaxID=48709 RepID=A0A1D2MWF7_ORCCI|nr:39S ribosomal protein L41, mitochondrial [Orchesella cincta]